MSKIIAKFIALLCSLFNEHVIKQIIQLLYKILADRYSSEKPKDKFIEKHPSYRKFEVDPLAPVVKKKNH